MRASLALVPALAALALSVLRPAPAAACGGCFHPPPKPAEQESVITDHRMAFALSPTQTILWDQVRYSGDPQLFAWVLPVRSGARVELADDAFLAALSALSTPTVSEPPASCGGSTSSSTFGCGASSNTAAAGFAAPSDSYQGNGNVTVVSQSVVGPYDSVTLRSSNGDALDQWLVANGFDVPASVEPIIQAYVNEGFDFIALKLAPGEGVRAMEPVRIVTPGADPSLPLRMVAAGVGANVGLELYVLSEGRYHPANFPDATIDFTQLAWDPHANESNYAQLATAAMAAGDGRGWLTEFAGQPPLDGTYAGASYAATLDQLYAASCTQPSLPTSPCDAGNALADADADADADAAADAAAPSSCSSTTAQCDDVRVALQGMDRGTLWLTRLRAMLPASALAADLLLEAAPKQTTVANAHFAAKYTDPLYNPCNGFSGGSGNGACACTSARDESDRFGLGCVIGAAFLAAAVHARRRARR